MRPDARICRTCGALRVFSGKREGAGECPACGSTGVETLSLSGKGRLYSYTRVHVPARLFQAAPPYWLVLVDLDEGHRVMGRLVAEASTQPAIGAPVGIESVDESGLLFRLVG
ncbi:MAG: OB-fold domain-containing protein [Candidatus Tectomicrobia bacterium]|nr:OB-fold domain-containing protein [Candidatus Tectomicrobia bacterium]